MREERKEGGKKGGKENRETKTVNNLTFKTSITGANVV